MMLNDGIPESDEQQGVDEVLARPGVWPAAPTEPVIVDARGRYQDIVDPAVRLFRLLMRISIGLSAVHLGIELTRALQSTFGHHYLAERLLYSIIVLFDIPMAPVSDAANIAGFISLLLLMLNAPRIPGRSRNAVLDLVFVWTPYVREAMTIQILRDLVARSTGSVGDAARNSSRQFVAIGAIWVCNALYDAYYIYQTIRDVADRHSHSASFSSDMWYLVLVGVQIVIWQIAFTYLILSVAAAQRRSAAGERPAAAAA